MTSSIRSWFVQASDAALGVLESVPSDAWGRPGLGEWSVRELAAHLLRAWMTVTDYLAEPAPEGVPLTAAGYLAEGLTLSGIHAGVLARGRADAAAIDDVVGSARLAAGAARAAIATVPDDRVLASRIGPITLGEFLRTRAFEATVHGLDVVRATGQPVPELLAEASVPALGLLAEVSGPRGLAVPLLLAASGRADLPDGFTLLG